jgi:hypothetical protein
MVTQRVQMKWVLPWLVRWSFRASTGDFCIVLAALVGPVQNIFFLTVLYIISIPLSPSPSKLGRVIALVDPCRLPGCDCPFKV